MTLKQLQLNFLNAIYALPAHSNKKVQGGETSVSGGLSQGMQIYQHAYHARLKEALDSDFPALGALLGDTLYDQLFLTYIAKHRPHSPSLNDFAQELPSFIAKDFLPEHAIAQELADFEWLLRTTFDAEDSHPLSIKDLAGIHEQDWPDLQIRFVASLTIRIYQMNTPNVWQQLKDEKAPEIVKLDTPQSWVIWRQNLVTQYRSMETDEACSLDLTLAGASFSELCEGLLEWYDEAFVPTRAIELLQQWLRSGMVAELLTP